MLDTKMATRTEARKRVGKNPIALFSLHVSDSVR